MALKEFYNTNDDISGTITTTAWYAQTWTTTSSYNISSVKLKLYWSGSAPANVIVGIRATTEGKPSGADLTSGSILGSAVTEGSPGTFIEIPLTSYALADATKYAIVVRVDTNSCYWRADNSSPTYDGGNGCSSTNSGVAWTTGSYDFMFEVYGSSTTYSELSGTIEGAGALSGNLSSDSISELSGTIAGIGAMSGNLGSVLVNISSDINYKRLVAAGSNGFYYEDIT